VRIPADREFLTSALSDVGIRQFGAEKDVLVKLVVIGKPDEDLQKDQRKALGCVDDSRTLTVEAVAVEARPLSSEGVFRIFLSSESPDCHS
jgi:hypothetical protein